MTKHDVRLIHQQCKEAQPIIADMWGEQDTHACHVLHVLHNKGLTAITEQYVEAYFGLLDCEYELHLIQRSLSTGESDESETHDRAEQ